MINLLDGLRDLKAPLASGLMVLFGLWLIFANEVASAGPGESIAGNLHRLINYLGGPATLGLIAFLGYLLGLVLNLHLFYRSVQLNTSRLLRALGAAYFKRKRSIPISETKYSFTTMIRLNDYIADLLKDAHENRGWTLEEIEQVANVDVRRWLLLDEYDVDDDDDPSPDDLISKHQSEFGSSVTRLRREITADMDLLAVQLHAEKEKIYEQYDKNKTESDFRAALIYPLLFVAIILSMRLYNETQDLLHSYSVLVIAILIVRRLAWSADQRLKQANEAVLNSLVVGHIKSPRMMVFEQQPRLHETEDTGDTGLTQEPRAGSAP